jgi:hypothetical protein
VPDSLTANDRFELGNTRIQSPTKAMARDLLERFAKGGNCHSRGEARRKSSRQRTRNAQLPTDEIGPTCGLFLK